MPSIVKNKGMAKAPSFYKIGGAKSTSTTTTAKPKNIPILIGIVALGAGLVLYLRSKDNMSSSANVGPALTIVPTTDADQSNIANMLQALKALAKGNSSSPGGGTSTPITQPANPPNTSTPNNVPPVFPNGVPIPTGFTPMSNTGANYEAALAALAKLGLVQDRGSYKYIDSGALAKAPEAVQQQWATATGVPTSSGSMGSFSGVKGTTSVSGSFVYEIFKNGQLVGSEPGSGSTDTAALGAKYGVAM